ncbi:MAG TPA: Na+/glucose cotransporter, partial [Candidatus Hydrogenedentes bacterium]|nr:Na+/glucose cotransporter [Candidatus Hydrogenedentota bacterium]
MMVRFTLLDTIVLVAYLAALVGIGLLVSYRRRKEEDQFLAGRTFGWFNVGLSIFGTNIGPSFLIASASAAYATG